MGSSKGYGWLLEVEEDQDDDDNVPLLEALEIDFSDIGTKFKCALLPTQANRELLRTQDDFWGPLFVVLLYATISIWGQFRVLPWTIMVWICGAGGSYFLIQMSGGGIPFSHSLSMIGYGLLPLCILTIIRLFV